MDPQIVRIICNGYLSVIFLFLGIVVYIKNRHSLQHKLFLAMCICHCAFFFCVMNISVYYDIEKIYISFLSACACLLAYIAISTHFCFSIVQFKKLNEISLRFVIYAPASIIFFIFFLLSEPAYTIVQHENGSIGFLLNTTSKMYISLALYFVLYFIVSIIVLVTGIIKPVSKKNQKQAAILCTAKFVTFLFYCYEMFFIAKTETYRPFDVTSVTILIWISAITYAIIKYRFMSISPAVISNTLLTKIDEYIILCNEKLELHYINKAARDLLRIKQSSCCKALSLKDIIKEHTVIQNKVINSNFYTDSSVACKFTLTGSDSENHYIEAVIKTISDSFGDKLGTVLIGYSDHKPPVYHNLKFTQREDDILQLLVSGSPNLEISKNLSMSNNTLKTHLKNMYRKCKVGNKIELLQLLKSLNLIPEKDAQKKVIIL